MNLWWEREHGPAPAEPPDGAVVRIVCADGAVLLAERDDWSLRNNTDRDSNPPSDTHRRRWFVHNHEFPCWDQQPRTWSDLVGQAQRLIIFVAATPAHLAEPATGQSGKRGDRDA